MNNSIKYTIDEDFCKSKEYFIAMTRIHEFLKDVIVDDISDVKNDTMIKLLYTDNESQMYSIIRLVVVLANNIYIKENETGVLSKLYTYLIELCKEKNRDKIDMIDEVYRIYGLTDYIGGQAVSPSTPSGARFAEPTRDVK